MYFTPDWNEYFIGLCAIVSMPIYFVIRKHFRLVPTIVIWLYTINFVEILDYALAATPFQVYYCGDNTTYELSGGVLHAFVYPPYSFLFLYLYDKWGIRGKKLIFYLAGWTAFSIFFEWLCLINHVFTYTGWKLYYSIPIYPISTLLLIRLYHFIQKHLHTPVPHEGPAAR